MDLVDEIEAGLKKPGKSKGGLAKKLGRHQNVVTYILARTRRVTADEVPIIRKYLELEPRARLVGMVGATSDEVFYGASDDPGETVPMPLGGEPDTVGVEIKGDSLGAGLNGWVAFYNDRREPITDDLLGVLCVVGLPNNKVLIKVPKKARGGRFHLFPNGVGDPLLDQKVTWAARVIGLAPKGADQ